MVSHHVRSENAGCIANLMTETGFSASTSDCVRNGFGSDVVEGFTKEKRISDRATKICSGGILAD